MAVRGELVTMLRKRLMVLLLVCCYTATCTTAIMAPGNNTGERKGGQTMQCNSSSILPTTVVLRTIKSLVHVPFTTTALPLQQTTSPAISTMTMTDTAGVTSLLSSSSGVAPGRISTTSTVETTSLLISPETTIDRLRTIMRSASNETSAIFEVSTSLSSQSNPVGSFNEPSSSVIYSPTSTPKPVLRTEAVVVGGAVGGVVLAVVLITIISLAVVVCLHQRNKKQKQLAREIYSSSDNPYTATTCNPRDGGHYSTVEPCPYETPVSSGNGHTAQGTNVQIHSEQLSRRPLPNDQPEYEVVMNSNASEDNDQNTYSYVNHTSNGTQDRVYFTVERSTRDSGLPGERQAARGPCSRHGNDTSPADHMYFMLEKKELVV